MKSLSFKALILGFIVDTGGSFVAGMIFVGGWIAYQIAHGVSPKDFSNADQLQHSLYGNISFMVISILLGAFFTILGGAVTGWLAPATSRLLNAAVLGFVEVVLGLCMSSSLPFWYTMVCALLTLPSALFGGLIVKLVTSDLKPQL